MHAIDTPAPAGGAAAHDGQAPRAGADDAIERYAAPTGLREALAALAAPGGATVLAGGTDLMPRQRAQRVRWAPTLLNIRRVAGLADLTLEPQALRLGALVTLATLRRDAQVQAHAPLLAVAADHFASDQVRNAATLGGNVCHASPAGDTLPPLLALDAQLELASLGADGAIVRRVLPIDGFFTGPGRTQRAPDELLLAVRVPLARGERIARFVKAGTRPALDISAVSVAFVALRARDGALRDVRIVLGAVAPVPLRARAAEALLEGRVPDAALVEAAAASAAGEARPIDDVRASAWYRTELVRNLTKRILDDAARS